MKSPSESGTSEPHGHSREAAPSASGAQEYLGLVVVYYLQLMSGRFEKRNQEMSTISRVFKLLSKELNVPMPVLSQLSAAPEMRQGDHRPQLSDLHESGSIEQEAVLMAFTFR